MSAIKSELSFNTFMQQLNFHALTLSLLLTFCLHLHNQFTMKFLELLHSGSNYSLTPVREGSVQKWVKIVFYLIKTLHTKMFLVSISV